MAAEVCCRYNGVYFECTQKEWKAQNENCSLAKRSTHFNHCMYFCAGNRCDNSEAHKKAK